MRFIGLMVIFFLTGCQTTSVDTLPKESKKSPHHARAPKTKYHNTHQDGAPPGPLPSIFKRVHPKNEPLSRYGNPDSYHVDGQTYSVMTSATGYRTRGLASWYGTKFHKKRTSSGEDYNMYALTAAHKTLPLPTYVKIKNLENGRMAVVKVNDRGPFHQGRVIDLSYAAAAKLGLFPKGTAQVEIEALTTPHGKQGQVPHYYLQAGAFSSAQLAESLRLRLARVTPSPVFVEQADRRYLVRVGPFATKAMSDGLKRVLARNGVDGSFSLLM
jgi:rare lipoprotein A